MKIKKNKTNYTIYIAADEELLIYAPPYLTDGKAVVSLDADRISVRLPAGLYNVKPNFKSKTGFRASLTDEGHAITEVAEDQAAKLAHLFELAGVTPLNLTPFYYDECRLYVVGPVTNGIDEDYAEALIDNPAMCHSEKHPVVVYRDRAKLGRLWFAAIMPTSFASVDDADRAWLGKLAVPTPEAV